MSAKTLHEKAQKLFQQQRYDEALTTLSEALALAEGDKDREAQIYNDLGVIYRKQANYDAAHDALDKAFDLFTELDDNKGVAQTQGNWAALHEAEGDLEEAIALYRESAQGLEEAGESQMAMYVWQAISRLRLKQKEYIAAIAAYEEGVENMPQSSLKRKLMQQFLKVPGRMMGNQ